MSKADAQNRYVKFKPTVQHGDYLKMKKRDGIHLRKQAKLQKRIGKLLNDPSINQCFSILHEKTYPPPALQK